MSSKSDSINLALDALERGNNQKAIEILVAIDHFESEEIDKLFIKGDRLFHQDKYAASVIIFEQLYRSVDRNYIRYFDLQRGLVKAYQKNQQTDKAIALCRELADSNVETIKIWGERFLLALAPDLFAEIITSSLNTETVKLTENVPNVEIKFKTLAQFKQYCQDNLLDYLKKFEHQRKQTLITLLISGIICFYGTWLLFKLLIPWSNTILYLSFLPIIFIGWIYFCRSCIQVYSLNFKRNIIENIVKFIDPRLEYANSLFLEDKRQTIVAFTQSQLFRNNHREPDSLEQEDCVYGKIGNTNIFFAEILVEDVKANYSNLSGLEEKYYSNRIFKGLFFTAKFAKNFKGRVFVLPNDLKSKAPLINHWRGELVKLEDPEFNRIFSVYGDQQIESRYILSTNLMNRLIDFHHKAKRKIYISFIEGYIYVAIKYNRNLFEAKLWQSMLSFAPLREYYENLQLAINIVEDFKLNRRIWKNY